MEITRAHLAGAGCGTFALVATLAYLASIEVDDGLEALIVVPLLAGSSLLVAAPFGARGRSFWRTVPALSLGAATVPGLVGFACLPDPADLASVVWSTAMAAALVAVAGTLGWSFGAVVMRRAGRRRPAGRRQGARPAVRGGGEG